MNNYGDGEDYEMPTPCEHCGKIFDLNDGYGSEKWHPDIVICEKCHNEEKKEIERDEEIENIENELGDAYITINDCVERAEKIGYKLQDPPKEWVSRNY
jgi:hypothetical protein